MNTHWNGGGAACPIVEFHDVRTEAGQSEAYLGLLETRLGGALVAAGGREIGSFRVGGHPDRLMVVRGYADMAARRRALGAFHEGADWARHRRTVTDLTHAHETLLTRAVVPADGPGPLRGGDSWTLLVSELRFAESVGSYHLWLRLLLRKAGMDPVAAFATLEAVNDVPAVPVVRNRSHHVALLRGDGRVPGLPPELRRLLQFAPEVLRLEVAAALVW